MKYDIFVSYRRADRELVASVVRRLEARKVQVWYDAEIEGGADWREVIVDALSNSEMLAIFFSDDCNNSRQLKKELAVADSLGKPVVPILIEDTQPRGAYLYELADRNWIQMFPEPMDRIEELVEHLVTLAGKTDGPVPPAAARPSVVLQPQARNDNAMTAPAPANDVVEEAEQPLDEAVGEFIAGADQPARPAPKIAKAYVGRVSDPGPIKQLNDIPPFRWIDLAVLVPIWIIAVVWSLNMNAGTTPDKLDIIPTDAALIGLIGTGLYGALVFPVRYYLRRRAVIEALWKYLASTVMIFLAVIGVFLVAINRKAYPIDDFGEFVEVLALVWLGYAAVAFLVYGLLSGQRAIRSFRSNIRKI